MFNWGSQAPDGFCWTGAAWGTHTAPPLPQQAQPLYPESSLQPPWNIARAGTAYAGHPTLATGTIALQQSRSGAAALSAARAQQQGGSIPDPFSFRDTPQTGPAPHTAHATRATGGWRSRSTSFLLGGSGATSSRPAPTNAAALAPAGPQPPLPPAAAAVPPARSARLAGTTGAARPGGKPARPPAAARAPPGKAAAAPALAPAPAAAALSSLPPAPALSLSLERYLELWQLLTKGSGVVQPLSELERSMLKHADLKQILLANGLNATSRTKKEIQERMGSLQLFNPLCLLPEPAGSGAADMAASGQAAAAAAAAAADAAAASALPDAEAVAALGWVGPAWDAGSWQAGVSGSGGGSCCPLPQARIRTQEGAQEGALAQPAPPAAAPAGGTSAAAPAGMGAQATPPLPWAQCAQQTQLAADSQATMASAGAASGMQGAVQVSPEVAQRTQHATSEAPCTHGPSLAGAEAGAAGSDGMDAVDPPQWLVQGVAGVGERSQGSADAAAGRQLLGRRVAFVLLEDFEQGDAQGITDTVHAGVLEGQVVEPVGVDHDEDCPPGCTHAHAFHYVRVPASASTAPAGRRAGRRLDLVVDLQEGLRQRQLERLLALGAEELQDAWVLLEPRAEPEESEANVPGLVAAEAAAGGGWRTKRGAQGTAPPLPAKRQHAAELGRR